MDEHTYLHRSAPYPLYIVHRGLTRQPDIAGQRELEPPAKGAALQDGDGGHGQGLEARHERPQIVHEGRHLCFRSSVCRLVWRKSIKWWRQSTPS